MYITWGQEHFRKPLSVNYSSLHPQTQAKTLPFKEKVIHQQHPETRWTYRFWSSMLPSTSLYFNMTMSSHILHVTTENKIYCKKVQALYWPACSSDTVSYWKRMEHYKAQTQQCRPLTAEQLKSYFKQEREKIVFKGFAY